ncbi:MAG TPA: SusC/RagA family TonB-linked outer membrane protein [Chitinophagaceae bacterium]
MKHTLYFIAITGCCIFSIPSIGLAGTNHFFQQNQRDSVPVKTIQKVKINVRDLMDGTALDSVFVTVGLKKGYTDKNGVVEFDSIRAELGVTASKTGYLAQSQKAKAVMQFRLGKRESSVAQNNYKNGLYERPLEHYSGASTIISGNELRRVQPINFVEALRFFDPSLVTSRNNLYGDDPNVPSSVKIRGAYNFPASASIASNSGTNPAGFQVNPSSADFVADNIAHPDQPVILLNGVQVSLQTAADIDINRIEKVTILKDAAATAVYGARGGTGVILIQTKLPQKGNLSVTYSGQVSITTADLSSYRLMGAQAKLELEQAAGMYTDNNALYQSRLNQVNKGVNTNWLGIPTRTGLGTKHYLSLEGGDDDISYGLDYSYNSIQGVMKGSHRNNMNFGGYINTRIKNLTINNYLTYMRSNGSNSPYGSLTDYAKQNAYWDPYDSVTGKMTRILEEYTFNGTTTTFYNPAYNGTLSTTDEIAYSRLSNLTSFNWNIGYGFRLNGRFAISKQSDERNIFLPPGHTTYADFDPSEFFRRGQYNQTTSEFFSYQGALNLHYNKRIGLHQLYTSAGVSAMETNSQSSGIELVGFTTDKLSDLAFGNAYSNSRPETGKIITRLASTYANVTYSFDNRYQLEVSGNADGSSQYAANNRIVPHWSVGASWNLHQERFFSANNIVNQLRIRGSVGTTGNLFYQSYLGRTNYNYYTDRQYIQGGSNLGTRGIGLGAFLTGFANDDLKAPETFKQNIGMDAVLLQNRLFVRVEAYRNRSKNLVLPVKSPASSGFQSFSYYDNLGEIENKGWEFDLNYIIIRNLNKGITWSLRVNGIHNTDRIISTSSYLDELNRQNDLMSTDQTRPQPRYVTGQSPTAIWAVTTRGIDPATGREMFLKADGTQTFTWDAADKTVWGDLSPDIMGTISTSVSVKSITLGVYFNYELGGSFYNQTLVDRMENADLTYNVDYRAAMNRWTTPGKQAAYKKLSLNGLASDPTYATSRFVEPNDVLNCAAISLEYSLPQQLISKIKASNVRVGFIGNNLFNTAMNTVERGVHYPFQKMYSFNITASF